MSIDKLGKYYWYKSASAMRTFSTSILKATHKPSRPYFPRTTYHTVGFPALIYGVIGVVPFQFKRIACANACAERSAPVGLVCV